MKRQKKKKSCDSEICTPRSVGAQYAPGVEQRNSFKKNQEAEPKQKQCPVVETSGGESML